MYSGKFIFGAFVVPSVKLPTRAWPVAATSHTSCSCPSQAASDCCEAIACPYIPAVTPNNNAAIMASMCVVCMCVSVCYYIHRCFVCENNVLASTPTRVLYTCTYFNAIPTHTYTCMYSALNKPSSGMHQLASPMESDNQTMAHGKPSHWSNVAHKPTMEPYLLHVCMSCHVCMYCNTGTFAIEYLGR